MSAPENILVVIDHGDSITVARGSQKITAPYWIGELVNCGFTRDDERLAELYRGHVKSPADTERIIIFASVITGLSRKQTTEALHEVVRRHTH
jgi:hypothetical protein